MFTRLSLPAAVTLMTCRNFAGSYIAINSLKISLSGEDHVFKFNKYARQYLGGFCFGSSRLFNLLGMTDRLINAACCCCSRLGRLLRLVEPCTDSIIVKLALGSKLDEEVALLVDTNDLITRPLT